MRDYKKSDDDLNDLIAFYDNGNKFVVLGNPKYDKMKSLAKSEYTLRDDCGKKLFDESGNKKFTVLLDTTLEMLVKKRENMLDKIGDVIDFFEKRDDLALIWRPHPLIESTLRNMYSELIPIYINWLSVARNLRIASLMIRTTCIRQWHGRMLSWENTAA